MNNNICDEIFDNISDNDKTGFLLWKVNNYWQRRFKKIFEELDLTHSQLYLLFGIIHMQMNNKEITQKELSVESGMDPMTTSTVLRTLQKKGWIKRRYNKKDSRTKLISMTEDGKKILLEAAKTMKIFNNSFFDPLKDHQSGFQQDLIDLLGDELKEEDKINILQ